MLQKPMRAKDFSCLLCGSRLELKYENLVIGENLGVCPMCGEPFCIKLNRNDIEELLESEELSFDN